MKIENEQILLDLEAEDVYYFSTASTSGMGISYPSIGAFRVPVDPGVYLSASSSVDIGASITINTEPTEQFFTMYPSSEFAYYPDILVDLDIPFKPKKTRTARGIVKERKNATFTTAFTEELIDNTEIH